MEGKLKLSFTLLQTNKSMESEDFSIDLPRNYDTPQKTWIYLLRSVDVSTLSLQSLRRKNYVEITVIYKQSVLFNC